MSDLAYSVEQSAVQSSIEQVCNMVFRYIPSDTLSILSPRCNDGAYTLALTQHAQAICPKATVTGIEPSLSYFDARERLRELKNVRLVRKDLRGLRKWEEGKYYDVVVFMRPPDTYKKNLEDAESSLTRACGSAKDMLTERGRIIIVRSHPNRKEGCISNEIYQALLTVPLRLRIVELNDQIVVAERKLY